MDETKEQNEKAIKETTETISETIKLMNEILRTIEIIDPEKYDFFVKKLKNTTSKGKSDDFSVWEYINELMKLQNELMMYMDTDYYKHRTNTDLAIGDIMLPVVQEKQGFFTRIFNKFTKKKNDTDVIENIPANPAFTPVINQIIELIKQTRQSENEETSIDEDYYRLQIYNFFQRELNVETRSDYFFIDDEENKNYIIRDVVYLHDQRVFELRYKTSEEIHLLIAFSEFLSNSEGVNELKVEILDLIREGQNSVDGIYSYSPLFENQFRQQPAYMRYSTVFQAAKKEFLETRADFYRQHDEKSRKTQSKLRDRVRVEKIESNSNLKENSNTEEPKQEETEQEGEEK